MNTFTINKIVLPILAGLTLVLIIGWMAGMFTNKIAPEIVALMPANVQDTLEVVTRPVPLIESVPAGIRARETTLLASRIMARIEKIHVRAGDRVKKGQTLISLENSALKFQIAQAKARIASIQALLDEAKSNLKRTQNLRQQGLASSSDLDKAQANFSRLSSDRQAANQSEKEAMTALSYSDIVSPIDGRIVDRSAEPGNMASPGQPLLSLYNPLSLLVEADVRESLAVTLQLGQHVTVKLDALNKSIPGIISELVPAADPNARSFMVKADIQFDPALLPGMFARMEIEQGQAEKILIPAAYVHNYGQLDMVWVLSNQQLSRRFVRVGERLDGNVEIVSGLEQGEMLAPGNL
ncbi:MAG: membrane fusion protein (multidrug efflux system) [Paraglaciecola sp.]|jgi:membrane fusion protein (multidrug efflux system)